MNKTISFRDYESKEIFEPYRLAMGIEEDEIGEYPSTDFVVEGYWLVNKNAPLGTVGAMELHPATHRKQFDMPEFDEKKSRIVFGKNNRIDFLITDNGELEAISEYNPTPETVSVEVLLSTVSSLHDHGLIYNLNHGNITITHNKKLLEIIGSQFDAKSWDEDKIKNLTELEFDYIVKLQRSRFSVSKFATSVIDFIESQTK